MKGGAAYSTPAPFSIARHTRSAHQDRFCHSKPISPRGAMMTAGARRRFGADFAIRSQIRQTHAVATCLDRTTTARFCRSKPIRPDALWLLTGLDQRGRRSIFAVRSQDPGGRQRRSQGRAYFAIRTQLGRIHSGNTSGRSRSASSQFTLHHPSGPLTD